MLARTHILFALLSALWYLKFIAGISISVFSLHQLSSVVIFIVIVLVATLVPDLDETTSTLGRRFKPVSMVLKFFLGHRGVWHSVWIPLLFYVLLSQYTPIYAMAIVVGYCAHLIADSLTLEGINFLYPLQFRIQGFIKTGSLLEQVFALLCVGGIMYILFL